MPEQSPRPELPPQSYTPLSPEMYARMADLQLGKMLQAAVDPTNPVTVEAQQIAEHERAMEDLNHTRDVLTRLQNLREAAHNEYLALTAEAVLGLDALPPPSKAQATAKVAVADIVARVNKGTEPQPMTPLPQPTLSPTPQPEARPEPVMQRSFTQPVWTPPNATSPPTSSVDVPPPPPAQSASVSWMDEGKQTDRQTDRQADRQT